MTILPWAMYMLVKFVQDTNPRIVYPGNLQGRHAKETGPKGCELVEVRGGVILESRFIALDVVRWGVLTLDAQGLETVDDLARLFIKQAQALLAESGDRLLALRVQVQGESALHEREAEQPGTIAAAIQAACQHLDTQDIWVERVLVQLRSPFNRPDAAKRHDAVGEVIRLVDAYRTDDAALKPGLPSSCAT